MPPNLRRWRTGQPGDGVSTSVSRQTIAMRPGPHRCSGGISMPWFLRALGRDFFGRALAETPLIPRRSSRPLMAMDGWSHCITNPHGNTNNAAMVVVTAVTVELFFCRQSFLAHNNTVYCNANKQLGSLEMMLRDLSSPR